MCCCLNVGDLWRPGPLRAVEVSLGSVTIWSVGKSFGGVTVWPAESLWRCQVSPSGLQGKLCHGLVWGVAGRAFGGVTAWFPSVIPMTGSQRSKIGRSLKLGRFGAIHSSNNYMRMSYTSRSLSWVFS